MRFAVIADIHGNALALEAVLADIAAKGIGDIVNLGDCFSGPLEADKVAETLLLLDLPTVRGNHDRYLIEQDPIEMGASDAIAFSQLDDRAFEWIRGLPVDMVWRDDVYCCHAQPENDNSYWLETVSDGGKFHLKPLAEIEAIARDIPQSLILCGHSHIARSMRLSDGRLIVNPGSVGCPAYDDDLPIPHKVEVGHPRACYVICEKIEDHWHIAFHQVEYDHMAMSALAAANGRAEWASALAYGDLR